MVTFLFILMSLVPSPIQENFNTVRVYGVERDTMVRFNWDGKYLYIQRQGEFAGHPSGIDVIKEDYINGTFTLKDLDELQTYTFYLTPFKSKYRINYVEHIDGLTGITKVFSNTLRI